MKNANYEYETTENGITLTKYLGEEKIHIDIPEEIDGKKVVSLGRSLFSPIGYGYKGRGYQYGEEIKTVIIPDTVTSIGDRAFHGCESLTEITIPEGVKEIEDSTFEDCASLTEITIPEGVKEIGAFAFANCESLTEITIPEGVKEIKCGTFSCCYELVHATIPNSVTKIGDSAFALCGLQEIIIPKDAQIAETAFTDTPYAMQLSDDDVADSEKDILK